MTIDECVREIIEHELNRHNMFDVNEVKADKCEIYDLQDRCKRLENQINHIPQMKTDLERIKGQSNERTIVLNNQILLIEADIVKLQAELGRIRSALDALTEKPKQKSLLEIFEENTQLNLKEYLDNNPFLNN